MYAWPPNLYNSEYDCYVFGILMQYLCEGGQKLLKRQYERVVASKQPHKVTEGEYSSDTM